MPASRASYWFHLATIEDGDGAAVGNAHAQAGYRFCPSSMGDHQAGSGDDGARAGHGHERHDVSEAPSPWQLSEALAAQATKEEIVEVARILAMQAAHYARASGEQELPDLAHLLSATTLDDESVGLLMDGTLAFVGVMATVPGIGAVDICDHV